MKTADLHNAYVWDCDECGTENWQRTVTIHLDSADAADRAVAESLYGDDVELDGIVTAQSYPDRVVCKHCKTEFKTGQYEDDEPSE